MTGQLTFNENSAFGRQLLQLIDSDKETTFKVEKKNATAADRKKKRLLAKMRKARKEAEEIMNNGTKGHTIAEILETI